MPIFANFWCPKSGSSHQRSFCILKFEAKHGARSLLRGRSGTRRETALRSCLHGLKNTIGTEKKAERRRGNQAGAGGAREGRWIQLTVE